MAIRSLLVANRGEIAIRIVRAARELGMRTVAVYPEDDASSRHVRLADDHVPLEGRGVAAYLDRARIVRLARATGCDAVHPGYGFLAENAAFAAACEAAGLVFVGPRPETLELFGDKLRARALAAENGIPLLAATGAATGLAEAERFFAALPDGTGAMLKAVAGGGGRGMRVVSEAAALPAAFERCRAEAEHGFGNPDLYVEEYLPHARHLEVQILGDGEAVTHLHERECSLQRRHQKLVEIAPSPNLPARMRDRLSTRP